MMQTGIFTRSFSIDVPVEWIDRSMQIWSAPPSEDSKVAPNVVVMREQMPEGKNLSSFVSMQMKELLNKGDDLEIEHQKEIVFKNVPAKEILFTWKASNQRLKQKQLFIHQDNDQIVSMVFTAAAEDFEKHLPVFSNIENSFSWVN